MNTCTHSPRNKMMKAQEAFAKLVAEAFQRGFFGTATLVIDVQDGRIQQIRVSTEKKIQ